MKGKPYEERVVIAENRLSDWLISAETIIWELVYSETEVYHRIRNHTVPEHIIPPSQRNSQPDREVFNIVVKIPIQEYYYMKPYY
jgi:hypothetical protein